jgi:predicted dehydrogenase
MSLRRTALLGFGNVAAEGHLPAWLQRSDFRLVAIADPSAARRDLAAARVPAARVYASAAELLKSEPLDAVDIASPPLWHADLIARAAAAGCHILCEKPLATDLRSYAVARRAVRDAGVTLCTVHNWKYSQQFRRVSAMLAEGAVGRLTCVRIETVRKGRAVTVGDDWRSDAKTAGGGILVDHGWHSWYLLLSLARQRPLRLTCTTKQRLYTTDDVEDTAVCSVEFPSLRGEIRLTWAGSQRRSRWVLEGTQGKLTVDGSDMVLRRGRVTQRFSFASSLAEGSHHPDWFGAVIDEFARQIEAPSGIGDNLVEAETCLLLTRLAYDSAARRGAALAVPEGIPEEATAA